ncbi:MAG: LysR family transcriptional regulator [Pseudomonadota bacterium]
MAETSARITLWGMEVFVAIANTGSISSAAKQLRASASSVSQQLSNLENALGTPLVDRAARPLRLTPAGVTFRTRAQSILNETALAKSELAGQDLVKISRLRLGMIEDFDADVTPRLLSEMGSDLAGCQFLLETGASHYLYDQLAARRLDVIVAADIGDAASWMEIHPLLCDPFVAVISPGQAGTVAAGWSDLQKLPFIHYTQRHHMGRVIAAHLARRNFQPSHRFELDSYHAIMAMVAQGAGWTIATPLGVLRAHRFLDDVAMVPLPSEPLNRTIALVARREILGTVPEQTAARLRRIASDLIVEPTVQRYPWLAPLLRVETG